MILALILWWGLEAGALRAQQREPKFELYTITGAYFHGNVSIAPEWRPQFGAGVVAPFGRSWGVLAEVTTSAVEAYWKHDGVPGAGPGDNFTRERRVVLSPSVVRFWRTNRVSVYAGGGVSFEHRRQRSRLWPIVARDENGRPVLAGETQDTRSSRTDAMLALRVGAIVSLTQKLMLRAGYSFYPRYADEKASKSLEIGVGYRF